MRLNGAFLFELNFYSSGKPASMAFNERKNSPNPPTAKTRMTIKSKDVMALKLKRIDEITPKISPVIEPIANSHPRIFLPL